MNDDKGRSLNQWGNDKYSVSVVVKTGEKSTLKEERKTIP